MQRRRLAWLIAIGALTACIANAPTGIERRTGEGGGGADFQTTNDVSSVTTGTGSTDPHAVLGADPPHGPFTGGTRVIVHGKGFEPDVRVWFGQAEATDVIAIDPTRAQVNAPPGDPGAVDVIAQNGDDDSTRRTLPGGFAYDALYAVPDTGPVAGGTVIAIFGKDTSWDTDLVDARIDNKPCTTLQAVAPDELSCTVPKGTPGAKAISVTDSQGTTTVLDAYTYQDSEDGFKGGLSGDALAGQLRVLAFDNISGEPLEGAHVIVGTDLATGLYQQVDSTGVAQFTDPSLGTPVTVTIAAHCHSPISFVDVPVDTVTVYLDPVLSPQCASDGDPPPGGGGVVLTGVIEGELVWPSQQEFQKGLWSNVPAANGPNEERIAFVFFTTRNRAQIFQAPGQTFAVTESSPGDLGYGFTVTAVPGNHILYAIAGIQNTQTKAFTAYAFGAIKGVSVLPGEYTESVLIPMDHALDQALTMTAAPPAPGPKGPDRLGANVVVELAQRAYAILPGMQQTPLIPLQGDLAFIGLPPLDGDLTGARYVASGQAATGPSLTAPLSVVSSVATTTTSIPVDVTGFVSIPTLDDPDVGGAWDGRHLAASYAPGGLPPDLSVYDIAAAGGLVHWTVAVPYADHAIELPDLSGFDQAGLPPGPLVIAIYGARYEEPDYGKLTYVQLRPQGMFAYALDTFDVHL
jgi:IPT/TIG domain-containing protein